VTAVEGTGETGSEPPQPDAIATIRRAGGNNPRRRTTVF
jgi:hypothetical protein